MAVNGRDETRLKELRARLPGEGHLLAPGDLAELDFASWLADLTKSAGLPLSGLAHCAGNLRPIPLRAFSRQRLELDFEAHVRIGASLLAQITRLGNRAAQCSLVVMSSTSASHGATGNALYGAARAAMEALARSFAVEFASAGIRCNCVRGGFMAGTLMTDRFLEIVGDKYLEHVAESYPLGMGRAEDAANAIIFLLGAASRWITGQTLVVDGGFSIMGN